MQKQADYVYGTNNNTRKTKLIHLLYKLKESISITDDNIEVLITLKQKVVRRK